jgi:hypothetical protein
MWLKIGTAQQRLVEIFRIKYQENPEYMEKSIYGLMETRLYCGSVLLKIGVTRKFSVAVSRVKF